MIVNYLTTNRKLYVIDVRVWLRLVKEIETLSCDLEMAVQRFILNNQDLSVPVLLQMLPGNIVPRFRYSVLHNSYVLFHSPLILAT